MPIPIDSLIKLINENKLPHLSFIGGEELYFIHHNIEYLKSACRDKLNYSFTIYHGDDKSNSVMDIISSVDEYSMFSSQKVIVVKEFGSLKKKDPFEKYFNNPPENYLFLVDNSKLDLTGKKSFLSKWPDKYPIFNSPKWYEKDTIPWVLKRFNYFKLKADENIAIKLISLIGNDLFALNGEIEKISLLLIDQKNITPEFLDDVIFKSRQFSIFEIINCLHKKDFDKAMKFAIGVYDSGIDILQIMGTLTKYYTNLLTYNALKIEYPNNKVLAKVIGTSEYFLKEYENASRRYSESEFASIFDKLLKKDIEIKTTSADERTILITLFAEFKNVCKK